MIGAAWNLRVVADGIPIRITGTVSSADAEGIQILTSAVIGVRIRIIRAACRVGASLDHHCDVAIAVKIDRRIRTVSGIVRSRRVEIACLRIGAAGNLRIVTNTVTISISGAIAAARPECIEVFATPVVRVGGSIISAALGIGATRNIRNHNVLIEVADAISVGVLTGRDGGAIYAKGVHLLRPEIAGSRTEDIPVGIGQFIPAWRQVVHSIPEEVGHGQFIAAIDGTIALGKQGACIGGVVVVAAGHHQLTIVGVLNGPCDAVWQGIELDLHFQKVAVLNLECHGHGVIQSVSIVGDVGPDGQFMRPCTGRQGWKENQLIVTSWDISSPIESVLHASIQGELDVDIRQ